MAAVVSAMVLTSAAFAIPVAASAVAEAAAAPCSAEAADQAAALAVAHACDSRVEVANLRSEVSRLFANPSGTMTVEQSAVPVRARDDSGHWAAVNTNLRRLSDGTLAPVVSAAKIRLSGGGSGPLVTLSTSRGSVSMSWQGPLPTPTVDGDSAVYPDVFPGVDLRVRAHADGFTHVLVVKTRQAAANPALRSVRYGLSGPGLTIRDVAGQHEIVNASGQLVAGLGKPLMWDSTDPSGSSLRAGSASSRDAMGTRDDAAEDVRSTPSTPGGQAKTATPQVSVASDALVIQPDMALLTDPAATFPIYVDPPFTSPWNIWAYSNSLGNSRPMDEVRVGADPDGGGTQRAFFRFAAWDLQGSVILDARLYATLKHSWSCAASYVAVYGAADPGVHGQVSWGGNPLAGAPLAQRNGNAHKGAGSCGNQPDQAMEFGGPGEWLDEYIQGTASSYGSWVTFALSTQRWDWTHATGYDEGNTQLWKKFTPSSVFLSVTYDHYPNPPAPAAMLATDCSSQCASPAQVHTTQPVLRAAVTDPDPGGQLNTTFEVRATAADAGTLVTGNGAAPTVTTNGGTAQWQAPSGVLSNGTTYYWRARSVDENVVGGGWSGWQTVTIDTSPPGAASVASAQYPYKSWGAAAGTAGTFTVTGGSDVVSFTWAVDGGATTAVAATGTTSKTATVAYTPAQDMVRTFRVSTMDAAGNISPTFDHQFWVSPLTNRCWNWQLDETAGVTAADTGNTGPAGTPCAPIGSSTTAMPATMTGSAAWAADVDRSRVSTFTGSGQLATTSAVLNTTKAFTVQAWAKFSSLTGPNAQTVLSQSGTNTSRFELQYRPDVNAGLGGVCFTMRNSDVAGAAETVACAAAGSVAAGEWVHLAGVYDPTAQQIRLYLRGDVENCGGEQADAVATFSSAWTDAGKFYIGRGSSTGDTANHFLTGSVDAVYAHQRALDGIEICQMSLQ